MFLGGLKDKIVFWIIVILKVPAVRPVRPVPEIKPVSNPWPGGLVTSPDLCLCVEQPGRLQKVQGMGWYLDEANIAQVSTNILDYELTPLHAVYEEICRDAEVRGHTLTRTCLGLCVPGCSDSVHHGEHCVVVVVFRT